MNDRLNTKDLMCRKNWILNDGPSCVLCSQSKKCVLCSNQVLVLQTREHLFFQCPFAVSCWDFASFHWDSSEPIASHFPLARCLFSGPCFTEVAICATRNIWIERNDLIFKQKNRSLGRWKVRFQCDLLLHQHRVKPAMVQMLLHWIINTFTTTFFVFLGTFL
jgi:hypothetical protein